MTSATPPHGSSPGKCSPSYARKSRKTGRTCAIRSRTISASSTQRIFGFWRELGIQGQVRGYGGGWGEEAAVSGRRECEAEEAFGGHDARQCRLEGAARKKMVTPAVQREACAHLQTRFAMSQR